MFNDKNVFLLLRKYIQVLYEHTEWNECIHKKSNAKSTVYVLIVVPRTSMLSFLITYIPFLVNITTISLNGTTLRAQDILHKYEEPFIYPAKYHQFNE
ncbi:MAG: hypothetical protein J6T10_14335 [Methanobrevibacter sp.]|nr:hypothetical protein [Methanobrevibacter sp.]